MNSPQDGPQVWASNGPPPNPFAPQGGGWQPQGPGDQPQGPANQPQGGGWPAQGPVNQPQGWTPQQPGPGGPPPGGNGSGKGVLIGIIVVLVAALVGGALWVFTRDDGAVVAEGDAEPFEMPDVVGEDLDDAVEELEDLGLRVRVREEGDGDPDEVQDQDPEEGEEVEEGDRVTVFVGEEPDDDAEEDEPTETAEAAETEEAPDLTPPDPPEPPPAAPPIQLPPAMDDMSMPEAMPAPAMEEGGTFDPAAAQADVIANTTLLSALTVADVEAAAGATCAWLAASPTRGFEEFLIYDASALVFVIQPDGVVITFEDVAAFAGETLAETGDTFDPVLFDGVLGFALAAAPPGASEVTQEQVTEILIGHFLVVGHACPELATQFETN